MATWTVQLPITGCAIVEVEADDEAAAIEAALDAVTIDDLESWEAVEKIIEGNVLYAQHPWEAEAERHDEGEN